MRPSPPVVCLFFMRIPKPPPRRSRSPIRPARGYTLPPSPHSACVHKRQVALFHYILRLSYYLIDKSFCCPATSLDYRALFFGGSHASIIFPVTGSLSGPAHPEHELPRSSTRGHHVSFMLMLRRPVGVGASHLRHHLRHGHRCDRRRSSQCDGHRDRYRERNHQNRPIRQRRLLYRQPTHPGQL